MMSTTNLVLHYLQNLPKQEKEVLEVLRNQIQKVNPELEERLSRGVPFFYYKGKRAVGFRSSKTHLSFFIMEGNVLKDLKDELSKYDLSSTVIRFKPGNPLPEKVIKMLVVARVQEIDASFAKHPRIKVNSK